MQGNIFRIQSFCKDKGAQRTGVNAKRLFARDYQTGKPTPVSAVFKPCGNQTSSWEHNQFNANCKILFNWLGLDVPVKECSFALTKNQSSSSLSI